MFDFLQPPSWRIPIPSPWRRHDQNTRVAWGYTFQWGDPHHLTPEQLAPMKQSCDTLADKALPKLYEYSSPTTVAKVRLPRNTPRNRNYVSPKDGESLTPGEMPPKPRQDLFQSLKENAASDTVLNQLWTEVNAVPAWVDWEQIARGQDAFYLYGGPMLSGLAFQSLVGGMGAGRVVETLARTGGFSTKVARHRMYETTQFILQCTQSLASIQPGGDGHTAAVRVRLLHAAVRRKILALAESNPAYYDTQRLGIPINDLDCIGTIISFSCTLTWLSLPRQGIFMKRQEIEDFVALWRYVAYVMGTPDEYFESPERAKATMEVLMLYEVEPTETSRILAHNVMKSLSNQPPSYASEEMLVASCRRLNGHKLCDALGLIRPRFYYYLLVFGQCVFFMSICYFYRSFATLRRRKVAALRKIMWKIIVESDYGLVEASLFDFKYIPDISKQTLKEDGVRRETLAKGVGGVENRNFKWLLIGCVLLGIVGILISRAVVLLLSRFGIAWGPLLHLFVLKRA